MFIVIFSVLPLIILFMIRFPAVKTEEELKEMEEKGDERTLSEM